MIGAMLLLAATVAAPPAKPPTPDEIFAAAKVPFGTIVSAYNVKQEFKSQDDGTFLGSVSPTFEEQQAVPVWSKERVENVVGSWDTVARRLGSVRNEQGQLVSIEKAFGISESDRATYLVASSIENTNKPGDKRCAMSLTGVTAERNDTDQEVHLVSRPYGSLTGCGMVKSLLSVAKPDFSNTTDPVMAWQLAQRQIVDTMAQALGIQLYKKTVPLKSEPKTDGGN